MNRWANGMLLTLAIGAAGATGFWFGHDSSAGAASQPAAAEEPGTPVASVRVQTVVTDEIEQTIDAFGTVGPVPGSAVTVSLPAEVRIARVVVAVGAPVAAGDVLFEISPTPEAELLLRQAKDALDAAERNLRSVQSRVAEELATNADLAAAEQAQQAARTQFDAFDARRTKPGEPVKSESAGVVAQVNVQAGQVVPPGTALAILTPQNVNEATLGVEPSEVASLKVGDRVDLADVHAGQETESVSGTIRLIAAQIDPQTRLRPVSVSLPAASPLQPGAFVVGRLATAKSTGLVVPRSAVLPDDDDEVLFVVREGKAIRRVVTLGLTNRERVQVVGDGLREGDAVVIEGNAELEDGMAVEVEPVTTQPTTAPAEGAK